jgi:nitrite reductase/ring-hydroxylating ferredoxin subunit
MTGRIEVGPADELDPGDRRIVSTDAGAEIGVFNLDGEFYAMLNSCRHQHGPVCEGPMQPEIGGEFTGVGERTEKHYTGHTVVKCPWHGWEYVIETGEHAGDADVTLPTFDVVVEDGVVYVEA